MDKETVLNRLFALRGWMGANGVRAFVVRDVSNIAWLTGFEGVFDEERAHTMVITREKAAFLTDSRYATAVNNQAKQFGRLFAVNGDGGSVSKFVERQLSAPAIKTGAAISDAEEAARAAEEAKPFAIEDDITLAEFRALEKIIGEGQPAPVETSGVIRKLRAVKGEAELIRMRKAQEITDAAFAHMCEYVQPGMTEIDVRIELEDFMMWSGASGLAFATIAAAGANSAKPHAVPGQTKLQAGQVLLLDFGAKYQGYCSDMTRCIFLGQPAAPIKHMYDVVREANETVEAALKPGVTGAEMQELAEKILANAGFGGKMGHGLGHGVGLDIHEEPYVNGRNKEGFVPGNVITVEPGIYLPEGKKNKINLPMGGTTEVTVIPPIGFRLEDCGVITDTGFDVFTKSPHELAII